MGTVTTRMPGAGGCRTHPASPWQQAGSRPVTDIGKVFELLYALSTALGTWTL